MRRRKMPAGRVNPGLILILIFGGLGIAWVMYQAAQVSEKKVVATPDAAVNPNAPMTDEERLAYIGKFIELRDLKIAPDTRPDDKEVAIPGLLRVSGSLTNNGERKISRVHLSVYPQDENGEVIESHIQNVVTVQPLSPKESRSFKFQIPENKRFKGQFKHKVH